MKAKIGIITIVICLIIAINVYWAIFTIPIFIIGLILLWGSDAKRKTKILWSVISPLLWLPLVILFIFLNGEIGMARAQKLEFRFPANFEGRVVIINDVPCGESVKIENGREILEIPESRILVYSNELRSGIINHKYKIRNSDGSLIDIPGLDNLMFDEAGKNEEKRNTKGVWHGYGSGNTTKYLNDQEIHYRTLEFNICSREELDECADHKKWKHLEAKVDSIIQECFTR